MHNGGVGAVQLCRSQRSGRYSHRVVNRKHAPPVDLAGDGANRAEAVGTSAGALAYAAVGISDHHAPVLVDGGVVEVQQVARAIGAVDAAGADGGMTLHRVIAGNVKRYSARSAIVSVRRIERPHAAPVRIVATASCSKR